MFRTTIALLIAALTAACATDHTLVLKNNTGATLTYCPVVNTPPPPHRTVSTTTVPSPERFVIDIEGFNPIFWDPISNKGIAVQMALADDPPMILARVFQFKVPPGSEGADPALQPTPIADFPYEVNTNDEETRIVIRVGANDQGLNVTFVET